MTRRKRVEDIKKQAGPIQLESGLFHFLQSGKETTSSLPETPSPLNPTHHRAPAGATNIDV